VSDDQTTKSTDSSGEFTVDFVKSQFFRVIYADGFTAGMTLGDNVHIVFWNSRDTIPKRVVYRFDEQGEITDVVPEIRADQIREVEIGITMGRETAKVLRDWLDDLLDGADNAEQESMPEKEGDR
jgi:hypothetical protein